ncbi:MAG: hypothetical protein ICV54_22575, partial [Nostoc sp. C3-bin3]|nr:hypothetical protein [Nostoc sp. C3-bin3]
MDIPEGEHQVVIVIDEKLLTEETENKEKKAPLKFSAYPVGLVSESLTSVEKTFMQRTNSSVFVDTNILVYANLALSPFHIQGTERMQALAEQGIDLWILSV